MGNKSSCCGPDQNQEINQEVIESTTDKVESLKIDKKYIYGLFIEYSNDYDEMPTPVSSKNGLFGNSNLNLSDNIFFRGEKKADCEDESISPIGGDPCPKLEVKIIA